MSLQSQKLPRRHAQRKALHHGRQRSPPLDVPHAEQPQALKLVAGKGQQFPISDGNDSSAATDSDSEFDTGYSSDSSLDSEAEHYRQVRAGFVAAGPNLANPCPTTKAMMKGEEERWKL
jgi:hypothetical protein